MQPDLEAYPPHVYTGMKIPDPAGVLQTAYRLTSFAMSLLLAFRLNRTYERWKEARSSMAGVVRHKVMTDSGKISHVTESLTCTQGNGATSIFLQAATWIQDNPRLVDDFRRFCIIWPYSIMQVVP
jgi:hypothetical protein